MTSVHEILVAARQAQLTLARASASVRNAALDHIAQQVAASRDAILAANARDLDGARDLTPALRDRLTLTPARVDGMVRALAEVRALPDPLGDERAMGTRPSGLRVSRRRIPLGVLAVVYEARPNVTVESAALAIKSGNAVVLRGGTEAMGSNTVLAAVVQAGLTAAGLPAACVGFIQDPARDRVAELLGAVGYVDLAIPRGGAGLMAMVDAHARVPVIRHGRGVCHVYVDAAAEPAMATAVTVNAKVQRPAVCNATETLLVHAAVAPAWLPAVGRVLVDAGVTLRADDTALSVFREAGVPAVPATVADWDTEFQDLTLAVACVPDLDAALAHIAAHGTEHTASIVTGDAAAAERFLREVNASCVLWNASTRFNDGGELGLGAEIGISTTRMHAFGPMGIRELTAEKFVVRGNGQIRV